MAVKQAEEQDERPNLDGRGAVIDPTKNVLDLVRAESKYQDAMRDMIKQKLDIEVTALKELHERPEREHGVVPKLAARCRDQED